MWRNRSPIWGYLALLLAANLSLLLPPASVLRVTGALLLLMILPGGLWAVRFFPTEPPLLRGVIAAGISVAATALLALALQYLPGPVQTWHLLAALNLIALLPLLFHPKTPDVERPPFNPMEYLPLLLILAAALFLRAANLSYSEFQGDEALAMLSAAESLEGHEDALFLRSKGPAEVLLPLALWRLTGTISEPVARLPFTLASLLAVVTIYLLGRQLGGNRLGWLAAGLFAASGFMVAFGRIVQYQALVVWFSALAVLLAMRGQTIRQQRHPLLAGIFLGVGLLAHYDAVLALPAIGWLLIAPGRQTPEPVASRFALRNSPFTIHHLQFAIRRSLWFAAGLLAAALPFYLPFALDPQANRTGEYVGGRIGTELRNNLPDFFHFNTFYSSFYFIVLTGLLVLAALLLLCRRGGRWSRWLGGVSAASAAAVALRPGLLAGSSVDLSALPFAVLLFTAFAALFIRRDGISPQNAHRWQAVLLWLAVPFLGYNFVVALGLTHIYTVVPAWSLLAACSLNTKQLTVSKSRRWAVNGAFAAFLLLSALFLWNAFVRHDVEYWQDYPAGNLPGFYTPYTEPPQAGFFGFAHRAGWKAIGQKIAAGELAGDYGSNEEPDVTTWYTRGAPRACDPQPEFYFLADDRIDPVDVPTDLIAAKYTQVGAVTLDNGKQMRVMQLKPPGPQLGGLDVAGLSRRFDQSATPATFARSARGSQPADANFGNRARLIGFDLDTRRAVPGGRVPVTLYWQALAPIETSYQVFTHLESGSGPAAQSDGVPVCWSYPTDAWRPGQIIADQHAIALPPEIAPGVYPLEIGLYRPDDFSRLDVLDAAGNPAGTSVTPAAVEVRNAE